MGPVRIKYWGMMWVTQPTYVIVQSLAIGVCLLFLAIGFAGVVFSGSLLPFQSGYWILDLLIMMFWCGVVALPLESIEMIVMLRKFARAEAKQRAELAALLEVEPAPAVPTSTAVQSSANLPPANTNIQP